MLNRMFVVLLDCLCLLCFLRQALGGMMDLRGDRADRTIELEVNLNRAAISLEVDRVDVFHNMMEIWVLFTPTAGGAMFLHIEIQCSCNLQSSSRL